ncbi:MAG TPA: hypothetical protein PLX17_07370 [Chitinophagaceae bacterium]|nr:hypothetical protein [Chitinophagaceae bacterium]MBP6476961.1 hypothetical protein [Chitinophagaceae bacterium]MBP7109585.1 hypothetical protein [Chitinophagaceae bacterium]MBP7314726.1 hypothetical protein [Chitinophagaceae bacterium]HQV55315.1 hypothetical protein [Chitinophagaceae bacterium]
MKRFSLLTLLVLSTIFGFSQTDHSGLYSYTNKIKVKAPASEKARGPNGQLVLLKMEGNLYRFWLDVTTGWPNYNVGETDGTITLVNDTASFDNTFEDAERPCILKFQLSNNVITINSQSTSFNCGFGNGVHADGEYTFDKVQPKLDNIWLQKEYYSSPTIEVIKNKAQLYSDENCLYAKTQFFVKGNKLLSIAENQTSIYTEFITPDGKFMWGWLNKKDVKIKAAE